MELSSSFKIKIAPLESNIGARSVVYLFFLELRKGRLAVVQILCGNLQMKNYYLCTLLLYGLHFVLGLIFLFFHDGLRHFLSL